MSRAITREVEVRVQCRFLPEYSKPAESLWMHAYRVTITNHGADTVRLVSRHWVITNARGEEEHVKGPGVVGEQPVLRRGETFEYTSGCPLDTPFGTMHGSYQMVTAEGQGFDAKVAPFTLAEPFAES